jgi:hypothetical protein
MAQLISINDRDEFSNVLFALKPHDIPLWGRMTPQQMVEHMISQLEFSSGKRTFKCELPQEVALANKQVWIYTDAQIPHNVGLDVRLDPYLFNSLHDANKQLMLELDSFNAFYTYNNSLTCDHVAYGPLNYKEWIIWHNKHFTHHFKQFNLI